MARCGGFALLTLLLCVATFAIGAPAAAAASVPFNPAHPTIFIAQGTTTQLNSATQSGGAISFTPVGSPIANLTYNAIGYDTCNNFIYAVQTAGSANGGVGSILKIASDGSITYTGINVKSAFNIGAFGSDTATCDDFYVGTNGTSSLDVVNVNDPTATPQIIKVGASGPDMTFANGFFWSMANPGQIQRIDVTPGHLATATFAVSTPAPNGGMAPTGSFGAAWTYGNGDVGFSNNNSGDIYEIRIANASSATPTFTTVISQKGPATSNNDGTNAPGLNTDLALTKSANPTMVDPGGAVTFSLTVTNNGPGNSSGYVLNDPLPAGVTGASTATPGCAINAQTLVCAGSPLAVGSSATATVTMNAPNPFPAPITNTATVTANENDPNSANNSASATVLGNAPAVSLKKTAVVTPAADQNAVAVGDSIQYAYQVTNTGNTPLTSVAVTDSTAGNVTCPTPPAPGLAPGASETCTADAPYVVKQSDVDAGAVIDSATATGTDATGFVSPASTPSLVTVPAVAAAPGLSVVKIANASSGDAAPVSLGETIQYSYVVTNTGNVDLSPVSVSDATAGSVTCPLLADPGLAPGQSETCTADSPYSVTQSDVDNDGVTDTATASATDAQGDSATSAPAMVHVPSVSIPGVSVDKLASVTPSADQDGVNVGDTIQYSYIVTNTGDVHLTSVAVSDPSVGAVSCPVPAAPGLAPGDAETCTADHPVTVTQADVDAGGVTDTATATGTAANGDTSVPSNPSTITVPAVPAAPAVSIDKSGAVDPASDQDGVQVGDTISYSYKVTNTGNVTLASVAVNDPSAGSVTCPTPASPGLAPGDSETCTADQPVTVTQADIDAGSVSDTATATGTDTAWRAERAVIGRGDRAGGDGGPGRLGRQVRGGRSRFGPGRRPGR